MTQPGPITITFLGTNGWFDTPTGSTPCVVIETADAMVILDAGFGIAKLRPAPGKAAYLFLSHFHLDHVVGLHTLVHFDFPGGLHICGPEGTRDFLAGFLRPPLTASPEHFRYPLTISEWPADRARLPFVQEALPLKHTAYCLGYRFQFGEKIITYCTDTAYCENAVTLGRDADVLITECALAPGHTSESWGHMNPQAAARVATEANARRLLLTHFDPFQYPTPEGRKEAEHFAKSIHPGTVATTDGFQFEI